MRIAVTGAAGYIGGWLTRVLAERGHQMFTQDRVPGADAVFDLGHEQSRRQWLSAARPDLVIHLAAKYGRVWGEIGMTGTAAQNAELARDCALAGVRLMFMSSSEVYGATAREPGPILERQELQPLNMYGMSKKWGEEACRHYAPGGLVITRLNMPYGPAATLPRAGEIPHHSGRVGDVGYNVLHTMLWQASHGMPITASKECERSFTWIGDACDGLALIAESGKPGTWNVCRDDDPVLMEALARRCVSLAGGASDVTVTEPDGQVTPSKRLDSGRLWQLGWRPQVDLDAGMAETLRYVSMFDRNGVWRSAD
jgi:GDP-L-fucose synthase